MAKISIQFHALPKELLALVKTFADDFVPHIVAIGSFPFEAISVDASHLDNIFDDGSPYSELAFTVKPPILSARGMLEFGDKNPDKLRLYFERPTVNGLRQSFIHARTGDPAALSMWKRFANRLRKMTKAGVIVINPDTGVAGKYRAFRYSAGAKALASTGVRMFPVAGENLLEFPDP